MRLFVLTSERFPGPRRVSWSQTGQEAAAAKGTRPSARCRVAGAGARGALGQARGSQGDAAPPGDLQTQSRRTEVRRDVCGQTCTLTATRAFPRSAHSAGLKQWPPGAASTPPPRPWLPSPGGTRARAQMSRDFTRWPWSCAHRSSPAPHPLRAAPVLAGGLRRDPGECQLPGKMSFRLHPFPVICFDLIPYSYIIYMQFTCNCAQHALCVIYMF